MISTGNPCPVCRDNHVVMDYRVSSRYPLSATVFLATHLCQSLSVLQNVKLLKQFLAPDEKTIYKPARTRKFSAAISHLTLVARVQLELLGLQALGI